MASIVGNTAVPQTMAAPAMDFAPGQGGNFYPQQPQFGPAPTDPNMGYAGADGPQANAFKSYLDSTGYQFQFGQGQNAITGSAAARGLLNSGATAKALTKYGQNIGKQYFSDYMGQLGNMNNVLGGTATAGQNALGQIATAGTAGGGNAANAIIQGANNQGSAIQAGGNSMGNAIAGAGGMLGNAFGNMFANTGGGGGGGMTPGSGGLY